MSEDFRIAEDLSLPRSAVTWVISYLAKRGAGKTYDASVQAEEMLKRGIPIVVVDGMGIWWGLRVSADGQHEGMPIVVFGGEHADLPLIPDKASLMAKAIVESNISCVLDVSSFSKWQARKILTAFLNELYQLNRAERHVYIEEADLWAPQKPLGPEENLCLSAVDNFVRRGGNHNLGVTLITQRSAVLNKDVLTQSDCLVVLRTLAPQDKKAIQLWVEEQTDEDRKELNKWYDSLKSLDNGEGYVWHPERPTIFQKVMFRKRETFHATREFIRSPQANRIVLMDVDVFIAKFKKVFEPKPVEKVGESSGISSHQSAATVTPAPPSLPRFSTESRAERLDKPSDEALQTTVKVTQTLPQLEIQQFKPHLAIPVESLNEPTTILGKVAVILKNEPRLDRWTGNKIKERIREHGWSDDGVEEAVTQLLRWEILRKQSNNYLYFYSKRVTVTENNGTVMAQ